MDVRGLEDMEYSSLLHSHIGQLVDPDYNGTPYVDADMATVRISYSGLKHGDRVTTKALLVRFADRSLTSFQIGYRLSADELPVAVQGYLHVRLEEGGE